MSDNITPIPPQPEKHVTRATPTWLSKLPKFVFKFLVKETTGNASYDVLLSIGRGVVKTLINAGVIAYLLHYWAGVSFDALIIVGIFAAAIVALILTQLIGRLMRPKGLSQELPAPAAEKIPAADTEKPDDRIKDPERSIVTGESVQRSVYTHAGAIFENLLTERRIVFFMTAFNGLPKKITFSEKADGFILLDGKPLPTRPLFSATRRKYPQDRETSISLIQEFSEEAAKEINDRLSKGEG